MDETIYVILKVLSDFALEVWFSIYLKVNLYLNFLFNPSACTVAKTVVLATLSAIRLNACINVVLSFM